MEAGVLRAPIFPPSTFYLYHISCYIFIYFYLLIFSPISPAKLQFELRSLPYRSTFLFRFHFLTICDDCHIWYIHGCYIACYIAHIQAFVRCVSVFVWYVSGISTKNLVESGEIATFAYSLIAAGGSHHRPRRRGGEGNAIRRVDTLR